jgi:hypothetical protein
MRVERQTWRLKTELSLLRASVVESAAKVHLPCAWRN